MKRKQAKKAKEMNEWIYEKNQDWETSSTIWL